MKTKFLLPVLFALIFNAANAQTYWELRGNTATSGDWLGTSNYQPLIFKTDNTQRVKFDSDGKLYFTGHSTFTYGINADSIRVVKYLDVDSIHCRTIKVGYSLTTNDAGPTYGGSRPYDQQLLNASNGFAVFESGNIFSNVTDRDNPKVVVGYVSSANGVFHKLNLHSNTTTDVFSSFTNRGLYTNANDLNASDGFKIGIKSTGVVEINQQENLDMNFLTNNNQRMVIKNAGNVGINTTTPNNKLEITHGTSGNSGLRLTNLTNTSSSITNTTDKILSVNSSGDVILVDDKQGTGSGTGTVTSGQNGLSTISGGTIIELGGNLIKNTTINSNSYNLVYTGTSTGAGPGNFGIGNLTATTTSALLHVSAPSAGNLFRITATDRDAFTHALTLVTSGANSGTSTLSVIGRGGNGVIRAMKGAAGLEITSQLGAFNHPGLAQISGIDIAVGKSDTILNFYPTATAFLTNLGTAVRPWSDLHLMSRINQPSGSPNLRTLTINLGNSRDDVSTSSANGFALTITTVPEPAGLGNGNNANSFQNVGYMQVTNPDNDKLFTIVGGGNVGIGLQATVAGAALQIDGGTTATAAYTWSDIRLKKDINNFSKGLDVVRQLNIKTYKYNGKFGLSDTNEIKVGVMAQDIQQLIPEAVSSFMGRLNNPKDTTEALQELYQVNYNSVLFTTINAIKELDSKNQELDNENQELVNQNQALAQTLEQQNQRIDEILQRLEQCCRVSDAGNRSGQFMLEDSDNGAPIKSVRVELSNSDKIVLNQNEPNPFKDKTTIRYSIPNEVKQAEIIFFDNNGSVIKSILIETRGVGQLEVYSSNLSAGTYSYSLVADGISIDTKKMVNVK